MIEDEKFEKKILRALREIINGTPTGNITWFEERDYILRNLKKGLDNI